MFSFCSILPCFDWTKFLGIIKYIFSFRCKEPEELYELQRANWDPDLDYIKRQYKVTPLVTDTIILPKIPHESRVVFENLFLSNNIWGLTGKIVFMKLLS